MIQPSCQYPALVHRCETVDVGKHARAWYSMTFRLDLHLDRNHGVRPSSNRQDWNVQHLMRHEMNSDHGLEVPPWHLGRWSL